MKNLIVRALTGAVYVALLVGCTVCHPLAAFVFFTLVSVATLWEFGTIMNRHYGAEVVRPVNALAGALLSSSVWLFSMGAPSAGQMVALYGVTLLYLLVSELYRQSADPIRNWTLTFASQLYVAVPFALLPVISVGTEGYTWVYVLSLFVFLWTNDTGAYLCGSALHNVFPAKLFERISPKKSWVGSIGGGILTLLVAALISRWDTSLTLLQWLGFALVVVFFGTWGDLVESLLKRQLGIKDSGNILPGHGGLLDRFDSSLLALPAAVVYLYTLMIV